MHVFPNDKFKDSTSSFSQCYLCSRVMCLYTTVQYLVAMHFPPRILLIHMISHIPVDICSSIGQMSITRLRDYALKLCGTWKTKIWIENR